MHSVTIPIEVASPVPDPSDAMRHARRICEEGYRHERGWFHIDVIGYDEMFRKTFPEQGNRIMVEVTVNRDDPMDAIVDVIGPLVGENSEYREAEGLGLESADRCAIEGCEEPAGNRSVLDHKGNHRRICDSDKHGDSVVEIIQTDEP